MLSNLLQEESKLSASDLYDIKWATASLYSGGADTVRVTKALNRGSLIIIVLCQTVSAVNSFFKAMILYPDVQAQAQAEIDNVIGNDKLPTVDDRKRLPFVSALAMEALRWHIVAPTGVPHRVMEDDIHDGYLIPEGALIITNIWHVPYSLLIHKSDLNRDDALTRNMAHDSSVYQDPMEFKPARFIKTENHEPEPDPRELCFGFGRRYA